MNLLEKTEALFQKARVSVIEAAVALYECHDTGAWKERYESWGEFVEVLGISGGQATKMLTTIEHYRIGGGFSQRKLAEVELERLYLATKLKGTPEEQFEKALVLSRSEINSQRIYEKTGEEHTCQCRICGRKMS